jgi:thiol-disulfide isomerase/thioredoxin
MKRILFLASFFLFTICSNAQTQPAYKITVKVKGIKDSVMYLANYFQDISIMKDTAKVDIKNQTVTFDGTEPLGHGIYIFSYRGLRLFELAIGKEQNFVIETDTFFEPEKMKVKGSPEIQLFLDYLQYINTMGTKSDALRKSLKDTTLSESETAKIRSQVKDIDSQVVAYKKTYRKNHPETFLSDVFGLMMDIEVPEAPILANGRPDSAFKFYYYRDHYFDNFDWKEGGLLRTPIFSNKIKNYFNNLILQHPDSIILAADKVVEMARANNELFRYCVQYITNTYETSTIMGMDKVFVHMAKKYYCSGQAYWVDLELKRKICERAFQLDAILLFAKAPELQLKDTSGVSRSLHAVKGKYTLMYFWDPECGHCQKTTPQIQDIYKKYKPLGLEVYAIYCEKNIPEWKKAIREKHLNWINVSDPDNQTGYKWTYDIYSKPVIYLLDENKKIVLKRIDPEQLEQYLEKHLGKPAEGDPAKEKEKEKEQDKGKNNKQPKGRTPKVL